MGQRVTYRRKHSYNTRSNKIRQVRTPGGKLLAQYRKKKASSPKCGDCGKAILGVTPCRNIEASRLRKSQRSVSRAYGGSVCHHCVRNRIVRAFLVDEARVVKKAAKALKAAE